MQNNYDWKKIIKMVAVIGVLCLFVGIATRLMQKSQTSLNDYARKNPEVALAKPEAKETGETENPDNAGAKDEDGAKEAEGTDGESIGGVSVQEIYDNFYYTDEKDGYKFRVMYYNSDHEICKAEISAEVEDPQEALQYLYDLFKAGHEFENYVELKSFLDKF